MAKLTTPQMQISNATALGRSHHEFEIAKEYLKQTERPSILSFGCSTGEEVRTLKSIFPHASIVGCDISQDALRIAAERNGAYGTFIVSAREPIESHGPYDLIVCMSVFCRWPRPKAEGPVLRFEDWSETLTMLIAQLKPGGCLVIVNSSFPFRYHAEYGQFSPVRDVRLNFANFVDLLDRSGNFAAYGQFPADRGGAIGIYPWHYQGAGVADLEPWDFHDQIFIKSTGDIAGPIYPQTDELPDDDDVVATGEINFSPSQKILSLRYHPEWPSSTHCRIKLKYQVTMHSVIFVERTVSRIWFDGLEVLSQTARYRLSMSEARGLMRFLSGTREFVERT